MGGGLFSAIESQNKRGGLVTMLQRRMLNKSVELRLEIERSRLDADKRVRNKYFHKHWGNQISRLEKFNILESFPIHH